MQELQQEVQLNNARQTFNAGSVSQHTYIFHGQPAQEAERSFTGTISLRPAPAPTQ